MKGTLMVVSGGIEAVPGIKRAKDLGLHVVVSDGNPGAPGFAVADDHLLASTYDIRKTVSLAEKYARDVRKIDGVMCIAADVPLTVASVAARLSLPGISLETAKLSMDKLAMKEKFAADGVPVPWFSGLNSLDHLYSLVKAKGYPLVLKPVDSRGARGVLLLDGKIDLAWAWEFSLQHSPTRRLIVERFLSGPQVSTESIVIDGRVFTLGFADRNYEYLERYAPHIIENGGELPSVLPIDCQRKIRETVSQAAESMGVVNGVVKGDIVWHKERPRVIELAARLSGGYFCTHEIPLNCGVDFVGAAIRLALGKTLNDDLLQPKFCKDVVQRYLFPSPGRVTAVEGVEEVAMRSSVAFCEVRVSPGDMIKAMHSHPARAGVVIATANSREEAQIEAERAVKDITIITV